MGATLRYAKVVDRDRLQERGGQIQPGTESEVRLDSEPATADPFLVARAWDDVDTAITETWRIEDPHGQTVREPTTREVLSFHDEVVDEISDCEFEYADSGYQLVLEVEGSEVARADFTVVVHEHPSTA
ncbi:MAG: hypothetical protein ACR2MA_01885 [Egibacteraceae bacterium]